MQSCNTTIATVSNQVGMLCMQRSDSEHSAKPEPMSTARQQGTAPLPGAIPIRVVDETYVPADTSALALPLQYCGGDLGLGNKGEPWIYFQDQTRQRFLTHDVQWLLRHIDWFAPGRDQVQLLANAARHYDLDILALMGDLDWRSA